MQIAVVDDHAADRQELLQLLSQYLEQSRLGASFTEFSCAEDFLASFKPGEYELVFLDIYMGELTGMDLARKIYASDPKCRLIFFTTSHMHAVESYDVRAAYYLTKPLSYDRLACAMDSCCRDLIESNQYISIEVGHVKTNILLRDILYVDCMARKARVHLSQQTISVNETITSVSELLLQDKRFLCCNRNMIVNMQHIAAANQDDFQLTNGQRIPIRQRGKISVKQAFLEYSLRDLRKEQS